MLQIKNAISNLKINIDVCDFKQEQIIYDFNITECYLDINYILLFCKGNNNGGKEVKMWWLVKDNYGTFQMCNFLPSATQSWPWRMFEEDSVFLKLRGW